MIDNNHILILSQSLKEILTAEIIYGNKVIETSECWPKANSIIIFLEKPFHKIYSLYNIEFKEINDPHYWKSEYYDNLSEQILACRF